MNSAKKAAVESADIFEKVAFGDDLARAVVKATKEKPFLTLATGLTLGGLAGNVVGGGSKGISARPTETASYKVDRFFNPGVGGVMDRIKYDELLANSLTKNVGDLANSTINSYAEDLSKAYKKTVNKPQQQATLKALLDSDDMISVADPNQVANLFNTMVDIAPRMTKHREAVRSFLRQGLAHEGGIDPVLLGELAKAEARLGGRGLDAS